MARELDMDAGALSRLLERLVAKGLIERERSEVDRRVVHLRLTSEGAAVAAQVPNVLATVNNDFLQGMDKAEWQQLMTLLAHMIANGQALQSEGAAA
jgi:DNA-binding MarR family transcriptional regulator